jgi:RNA polymerase sigma-70 factor, ECF subfamily
MANAWKLTTRTTVLQRLRNELLRYFRKRVSQTPDAEDLLSQVWLAAGRMFQRRSSVRYYMFSIARRLVADHWSRLSCPGLRCAGENLAELDEFLDESTDLEGELASRDDFEALEDALATIPRDYRVVVDLCLRGYSNFEIAAQLGIHYHTVRSRLSRGKAHLLKALRRAPSAECPA